jgi:hypothetical protein
MDRRPMHAPPGPPMDACPTPPIDALQRDAHGRLQLRLADGSRHDGVSPVRAHPLSDPRRGVSLVGADGRERCWLPDLDALPPPLRALIDEVLAEREFMPTIRRLLAVSTFATPSRWTVETDRGTHVLVLKGEEDIRRLGGAVLLLTDADGVSYRIADRFALDRASRRLLERFL